MVNDDTVKSSGSLTSPGRTFRRLVSLFAALLAVGCSPPPAETPDVIILHSGRMRGNVYPLSLESISALQHYQYLAGYVREVRQEAAKTGTRVLLVDLGDSLTGSFASEVTDSANMVTFFNDTGYDAVVLSNLDHAIPPTALSQLKARVLNPFQDASGRPATEGTHIGARLDLDGLPVFLLANFYGDTNSRDFPDRFPASFGTTSGEVTPVREYRKTLAELGHQPGEGLTLLSWMKFESPSKPPERFLRQLRDDGVDAILAHRIYGGNQKDVWSASGFTDWSPPVSLNILRNNGGFALARLDLKRNGNGWKVLRHDVIPMTANTAPADPTVVEAIARYAAPIEAADATITRLPGPVEPETILKIYMGALATEPGTDAVLYSLQSIRTGWTSGELRASQVFNSLPWTTPVVQLPLTADQITAVSADFNLTVLQKDPPADGMVTVTTSQYFGRLIATKLGQPLSVLRDTGAPSEFAFFVRYLTTHPDVLARPVPPDGWTWSGKLDP